MKNTENAEASHPMLNPILSELRIGFREQRAGFHQVDKSDSTRGAPKGTAFQVANAIRPH
jgi:hypothetical protein